MARTTKKGSNNKKVTLRRPVVKTSPAKQAQTIAELRQELKARNHDLDESLQREKATAKELQGCKSQLVETDSNTHAERCGPELSCQNAWELLFFPDHCSWLDVFRNQ